MRQRAIRIEALESRQLLTALGSLDPTFGVGGTTIITDGPVATAPGPSGSQYFLSSVNNRLRVTRLLASGRFDRRFGGGDGIAELDSNLASGSFRVFHSLPDGRIVVIANSKDKSATTGQDPLVARLLPNGELDPSLGNGAGFVRADFYSALGGKPIDEFFVSSDVAADGSVAILVGDAGFNDRFIDNVRGLLVLNPDGSRDTRFNGGSGLFTSSVHRIVRGGLQAGVNWSHVSFTLDGNALDLAEDVNVYGANAHLVSGLHRLPRTGVINDGEFVKGPDVVLADYSALDRIPRVRQLVRLADGGLLATIVPDGGKAPVQPSTAPYMIVRVSSDLKFDANFGTNFSLDIRKLLTGFEPENPNNAQATSATIAPLPDGRFYLSATARAKRIGASSDSAERLGFTMRFLSDGKPDPLFPQIVLPDRAGLSSNLPTVLGTFKESVLVLEHETIYADDEDFLSATHVRRLRRYEGGPIIDLRADGTLVLAGSSTGEFIRVHDRLDGRWEVRNGAMISSFQASKIKRVIAHGYGGDDPVHIFVNKPATIWGGDGNDTLFGNESNDLIMGDAGDDWLDGGSGNDAMYGHDGRDTLYGGWGNDRVFGNFGDDIVFGGRDQDTGRKGDGTVGEVEVFI